jgi:hypothetical protein
MSLGFFYVAVDGRVVFLPVKYWAHHALPMEGVWRGNIRTGGED